jgi:hypothetical protein
VIPMKKFFKEVEFLFPKDVNIEMFTRKHSFAPFSDEIIHYLNALSKELNKDPRTREYPDVATFSFFCRKANIIFLKKKYSLNDTIRLGRGLVFHIAPSNVPVNFAYSLLIGLLAGNTNIVRVPSKNFEQVNIICEAIARLSQVKEHEIFSSRIILVRYNRMNSATSYFSSICDVRIIWGGDETIALIRENKIPPRSFDLAFADRYSLCAINADEYINEKSPKKIAQDFYNDTYLFDQNACTAPHLVIWLGSNENVNQAKITFWDSLYEFIKDKYTVQPVIAVDKLTSFYNQSIHMDRVTKTVTPDNLIWRIELKNLAKDIDEYRCTSGYFSEYQAGSLSEITKIIDKKYQTLSYYGIAKEDLNEFIYHEKPSGVDRIVPIGRTSDFSLTWDGYNLIETLSRRIDIK